MHFARALGSRVGANEDCYLYPDLISNDPYYWCGSCKKLLSPL